MVVLPESLHGPSGPGHARLEGATARRGSTRVALPLVLLIGCYAGVDGGAPNGDGPDTAGASEGSGDGGTGGEEDGLAELCGPDSLSESGLRRLTRLEYALTLQALLELETPPDVSGVPEDPNTHGFRTLTSRNGVSSQHLRAYLDLAERLAAELLADPVRSQRVIGCEGSDPTCLPAFVTRFGRLAYRRPLEAAEVDALVESARTIASDDTDALAFALETMLASPNFLVRVEGSGEPGSLVPLSPPELASRLSFAVWGRGPSAELLDAAEAGELDTREGLLARANAMLDDDRTRAFYAGFFEQWLGFEALRAPPEPPSAWDDALLADFKAETHASLEASVWSGAFFDVFMASDRVLTPALAAFYGVQADADGRYAFPEDDVRHGAGILAHPAILSAKNDGDLVAKRGAWFQNAFFCRVFEVPPGLFETIGDELVGLSYLEILDKRNSEAACAGCHAMIDPIGVGFAGFDALGLPSDAVDVEALGIRPAIPNTAESGREFDALSELGAILEAAPETRACLTDRVFLYTQGREPESSADACTFDEALSAFAEGDRFRDLVLGIVGHEQFRYRRNPASE